MSYDPNNIFAKILRGEAPGVIVEENEHTLTFMDVMPKADGHTLIIPKEPAANIFEISPSALSHLIVQVKRVAAAVKQAFPGNGVRIIQLNDPEAGQSVFHIHFHVIPSNDGMRFEFHGSGIHPVEELEVHASKIRAALATID